MGGARGPRARQAVCRLSGRARAAGGARQRLPLDERRAAGTPARPAPPPGLLDDLLARAHGGGIRERAAVPARGAVSGARPALSVAFLTVGAAASTGVGYAAYKGLRWALDKRK